MKKLLFILILLVGAGVGYYYWQQQQGKPLQASKIIPEMKSRVNSLLG